MKTEKNKIKIIAEVGVNHNGNLKIAKRLIDVAKKSGAEYVKFQAFKATNLVQKKTKSLKYQIKNTKKNDGQFNMLKKLEINKIFIESVLLYCKNKKINFLCTPFDIESLNLLYSLKIFNIKIASGEINNYFLLKNIAKKANKIFLSTGMADIKEISQALEILITNGAKKKNITLLHCHTDYPTNLKNVNLRAMTTMKNKFNINVGYSDHTIGFETSIAAVALGAQIIEKHITLNKKMIGPDHKASMEPKFFYQYVKLLKNTEILLGNKEKKPTQIEKKNMKLVRKSIVAKNNIAKGEYFSEKNISSKRPQGGLSPMKWNKVIGKKSKYNFKIDQFIKTK
jgi:N,N'-diacetyllegionaminate synthase|tara:strand:- start:10457 stop:11476 length:1020 start_codon:yes stop_codon:yes gene_type:complete